MEKEPSRQRFIIRKRDLVIGTALAASVAVGVKGSMATGEEAYKYVPYPQKDFKALVIQDKDLQDNEWGPGNTFSVTIPSPVPPEAPANKARKQLEDANLNTPFENVVFEIQSHPEIFNKKDIADIKMYYPIYKAVGDKFNIDWYLLWINHEGETGASNSTVAFNGGSYPYVGGWQRNVRMWPENFVANAFKGLEYLQSIKTRNKTDAREAAAMAAQVAPNIKQYLDLGPYRAVFNAERIFTGDKSGTGLSLTRTNLWEECSKIFGSVLIPLG